MSAPVTHALAGKKAIVTGASRGIGAQIAQALALSGASIVLGYSSGVKEAEEVIAKIKAHKSFAAASKAAQDAKKPIELGAVGGKLVDAASAKKFAQDSLAFLGGDVDIVIHNAAIMGMHDIANITEEQFDSHFNVNVKVPLFLTQALLPHINEEGRILFTSSSVTTHPMAITPGYLPYTASKGAVEQLTRVLSRDPSITGPKRRITVNCLNPGPISTELFLRGKSQEILDRISSLHPQGRIGQPDEVADAVVYFASPASRWTNGQILRINGGMAV